MLFCRKTKQEDLAIFHHTSICAPVAQTLVRTIKKNFFITFPGLTPDLISKNLPVSEETEMGHMNQERQGLQSTSKIDKSKDTPEDKPSTLNDHFPPSDHLVKREKFKWICYTKITQDSRNLKDSQEKYFHQRNTSQKHHHLSQILQQKQNTFRKHCGSCF